MSTMCCFLFMSFFSSIPVPILGSVPVLVSFIHVVAGFRSGPADGSAAGEPQSPFKPKPEVFFVQSPILPEERIKKKMDVWLAGRQVRLQLPRRRIRRSTAIAEASLRCLFRAPNILFLSLFFGDEVIISVVTIFLICRRHNLLAKGRPAVVVPRRTFLFVVSIR